MSKSLKINSKACPYTLRRTNLYLIIKWCEENRINIKEAQYEYIVEGKRAIEVKTGNLFNTIIDMSNGEGLVTLKKLGYLYV